MASTQKLTDIFLINVSIIYGVLTLIILIFSFILWVLRNTLLSKWKASKFHILSSIGMLFIIGTTVADVFLANNPPDPYPFYISLLYHLGFDLAFIPVILRGWRIVCLHARTYDLPRCTPVLPSQVRLRSTRWFWTRIGILFALPVALGVVFAALSGAGARVPLDWVMEGYDCVLIALMLAVLVALLAIHRRVNFDALDERRTMLALCVLAVAFFTENIVVWFYVLRTVSHYTGWTLHLVLRGVLLLLLFLVTAFSSSVQLIKNRNKRAPPAPRVRKDNEVSNPLHGNGLPLSENMGAKKEVPLGPLSAPPRGDEDPPDPAPADSAL